MAFALANFGHSGHWHRLPSRYLRAGTLNGWRLSQNATGRTRIRAPLTGTPYLRLAADFEEP
jgi:hypothetical protein